MSPRNKLYFGDNLRMMRLHIADESVDLVYLDPPFNSDRNYNVLFKEQSGESSPAQIEAFTDTWHWDASARQTYADLLADAPANVGSLISALREFVGTNDMMAYLVMMTARLIELHRVLKPTGSLYLHCDPTASHYLKIVLDTIFGPKRFLNEISWRRSSAHSDTAQGMKRCGRVRDVILLYTKTSSYTWNPVYTPYDESYLKGSYRHIAPDGRRYRESDLTAAKPGGDTEFDWWVKRPTGSDVRWVADLDDEHLTPKEGWEYLAARPYQGRYWAYKRSTLLEWARTGKLIHRSTGVPQFMRFADDMPGVILQDDWDDINPASGSESLGYPTQKPLALLERIIMTSSNPGDVMLDPFCGCGTAIVASQKLDRRWIGIDVTHLSIALMRNRLKGHFGDTVEYDVEGQPTDIGAAQALALQDRYDFQLWALGLADAKPADGKLKKGADRGIDGVIGFVDDPSEKLKRCTVQVKSGGVGAKDVRDLIGAIDGKAEMGLFISLEPTTKPMRDAAGEAGSYHSPYWGKSYPRKQLLTVAELLDGKKPDLPPTRRTFQQATKIKPTAGTLPMALDES